MNDEPQITDINADDNDPATKGDVRAAVDELAEATNNAIATELKPIRSDIAALKQDVTSLKAGQLRLEEGQARLESDVGHLKRSQEAILDVVKSIDQKLSEHSTHPDRLTRLERSVFRR